MIPAIDRFALEVGGSLAASIVAKVTFALAVGLISAQLARRSRAAVRHVLLAASFGVTLLLPVASHIVPPVRIAVPDVRQNVRVLPPPEAVDSAPPLMLPGPHSGVTPGVSRPSRPSLAALLITGWLAGLAISLIPMVVGSWKIRSLRQSGLPWAEGQEIAGRLSNDTGIHRRVAVLLHETLPGPIASGVLHPIILLPPDAQTWKTEDLKRALLHELEHVRRGDSTTNFLARVACALYWFHPLVWIALRKLGLEAERCCDDAVLGHSEATAYADQLVGLARRLSMAAKSPLPAMADRADLAIRVSAVLDNRQRRGRAGAFLVALGCVAAAILILMMAPLRTVSVSQPSVAWSVSDMLPGSLVDTPLPAFKSVSIRRSHGEDSLRRVLPDGLTLRNLPPEALIEIAYGHDLGEFGHRDFKNDQLLGGPSWARDWLGPEGMNYEGYDVDAKVDESLARKFGEDPHGHRFWNGSCAYRQEMMLMFQSLLADRFKLEIRQETREVPIYALIVGPSGPKILSASPSLPPSPCPAGVHCIQRYESMAGLADLLSGGVLDRPVVDQTELTGGYNIQLEWPRRPSVAGTHIARAVASTASMFAAVEQQLGLKLVPTQGPVDFLIIEHIERPSED